MEVQEVGYLYQAAKIRVPLKMLILLITLNFNGTSGNEVAILFSGKLLDLVKVQLSSTTSSLLCHYAHTHTHILYGSHL